MICYRDMTFCPASDCDNLKQCFRALTEEVKDGAEKSGFLIARFTEPTKLECYDTTHFHGHQNQTPQ